MSVHLKDIPNRPPTSSGRFGRSSAFPAAGDAGAVTTGRSVGAAPAKPYVQPHMSRSQVAFAVLKGDLDLAIHDLERMRRGSVFGQEIRIQLGRCLYELQRARRLAGA